MTGYSRPKMTLKNNSSAADPVDVILYDSQDFMVDAGRDPEAEDNQPLNLAGSPTPAQRRPFTISGCQRYLVVFRKGKLNIDQTAIGNWDPMFSACRAIRLHMQLADGTTGPDLIFDTFCTQHSVQNVVMFVKQVVCSALSFARAFVLFILAILTLRIFKKPKTFGPRKTGHGKGADEDPSSGRAADSPSYP